MNIQTSKLDEIDKFIRTSINHFHDELVHCDEMTISMPKAIKNALIYYWKERTNFGTITAPHMYAGVQIVNNYRAEIAVFYNYPIVTKDYHIKLLELDPTEIFQ